MTSLGSVANNAAKKINNIDERIRKHQDMILRLKEERNAWVRLQADAQNKKSKYKGPPKDLSVKDEP